MITGKCNISEIFVFAFVSASAFVLAYSRESEFCSLETFFNTLRLSIRRLTLIKARGNMFGHEKFGAYRYSIQFAALATRIIEKLPDGHSKLIDQLRRAAISISLNIAEGSGKNTRLQKCHCYSIARGEAMECAAIMDILECMGMLESKSTKDAKELLENIVAILSSVCKK